MSGAAMQIMVAIRGTDLVRREKVVDILVGLLGFVGLLQVRTDLNGVSYAASDMFIRVLGLV